MMAGYLNECHLDLARYQYLNHWIIDVVVGLYDNKGQKEKVHWHEKAILPNGFRNSMLHFDFLQIIVAVGLKVAKQHFRTNF